MNSKDNEVWIFISKTKAAIQTTIVLGLFIVLAWFSYKVILLPPAFNRTFLMINCSILLITFGLSIFTGLNRLKNLNPVIVISNKGLQINFGLYRGHFIKWDEITGFKVHQPTSGLIGLLIFVKNPDCLFLKSTGFSRFLLKMNNFSFKTPLNLTSNWLDCSFDELVSMIINKYEKTLHNKSNPCTTTSK